MAPVAEPGGAETTLLRLLRALDARGWSVTLTAPGPGRLLDRALWTLATPVLWAGGWLITSQVIVDADRQHAVFGASGALAVSALAGVLYALRQRPSTQQVVTFTGRSSDRMAA